MNIQRQVENKSIKKKQLLFSSDVIWSCHSSQLNLISNCNKRLWTAFMNLLQGAMPRVHLSTRSVISTSASTVICLNSISKGPALLTKSVCVCKGFYRVRHMYAFILLPLSQFPNSFMFPLYFRISSWMNWFENRRILHPVALFTYAENDYKKNMQNTILSIRKCFTATLHEERQA